MARSARVLTVLVVLGVAVGGLQRSRAQPPAAPGAQVRAFYDELARGTGRAEALRQAKLRLLRQKTFAHPYYWAAFIAAGDWTPLDPQVIQGQEHGR